MKRIFSHLLTARGFGEVLAMRLWVGMNDPPLGPLDLKPQIVYKELRIPVGVCTFLYLLSA
jgi:hypothetical protein